MPRSAPAVALVVATVAAGLTALAGAVPALAYSSFPPTDHVNVPWPLVPPAQRTCRACHTGFSGLGGLTLANLPPYWQPGQTYSLVVEQVEPGAQVFGFEAIALDASFAPAGRIVPTDPGTALLSDPDRLVSFLLQTGAGNTCNLCPARDGRSWTFDWEAPAALGAGTVTFFLCGNGGDASGTPMGDHVYCLAEALPEIACDPPLPAIAGLQVVRSGGDLEWHWVPDLGAANGYRLYAVGRKADLPAAHGATPAARRNCDARLAWSTSCTEPGAAADPGPLYYRLLGVCAAGLEGPN